MGDFYFLGCPAPKSCRRDGKIRAPKKKFPAPKFFFRAPFFSDGDSEALFSAIWNFFTDKSPMSICRHKPRPAYVSRQSRRGNSPHPRQKESLHPCLPTFGFPHVPRDCVFCARRRPLPRTSESQRPSNDKVSTSRENSKMSNPPQRPAGKHEIVPRYILLLLFLLTRFLRIILEKHPCNLLKNCFLTR